MDHHCQLKLMENVPPLEKTEPLSTEVWCGEAETKGTGRAGVVDPV